MKHSPTILIADRNPYVRRFMQREMKNAGYEVMLAENGRQLLFWVERRLALDLVILDPDLPDTDPAALLAKIRRRAPALPVIIHGHTGEAADNLCCTGAWFVEKGGNSIERMIQMAGRILKYGG